jgi:hypothetical protein
MERHRWGLHLFVELRRHPFNMPSVESGKLAYDFNATLACALPNYKHY